MQKRNEYVLSNVNFNSLVLLLFDNSTIYMQIKVRVVEWFLGSLRFTITRKVLT